MSDFTESRLRARKRKLVDRWARWVIAAGGFSIIASILAILFFIGIEALPLFESANVGLKKSFDTAALLMNAPESNPIPVAAGLEENRELGYLLTSGGWFCFFSVQEGSPRETFRLGGIDEQKITAVSKSLDGSHLALGTSNGRVLMVEIDFKPTFSAGARSYNPVVHEDSVIVIDSDEQAIEKITFMGNPSSSISVAAVTAAGRVFLYTRTSEANIFDEVEVSTALHEVIPKWENSPVSIALDEGGKNLYVGAAGGRLYRWTIDDEGLPEFTSTIRPFGQNEARITALSFLIGGRTLLVGDDNGDLASYSLVRDQSSPSGWRLTASHMLKSLSASVTALAPSTRGRGFLCGDAEGKLALQHTTSERTLAEFNLGKGAGVSYIAYAPKADGALTLDTRNRLKYWTVDNPHPEAGFGAFFRKVRYEGYEKPEYVWQSSAATDDFEPKLSIVPLIFGSLKGTLYALILSVPLAILAALYTSQFMHPTYRNYIKPTVEIMAALPSVVLGFLAGLWLAPLVQNVVPGIFLMMIMLPLFFLIASLLWRTFPVSWRLSLRPGYEVAILIPVSIAGIWLSLKLNTPIENYFFGGSFTQWIYDSFGFQYDQRNALIVGFAMGFAIIPIIYTISEDALSNVPSHIISGSLALGATRWQTAIRVVIPTAAAGIFSAVMIGFGRAVGETMIVLMATGNTPIMDWNIFNGFRTLAANIAVEIPEAPYGGTLYRVLFLTAFLLFLVTFMVNTVAEIVRHRVREKYQKM